jgi:hypothetical protein
MPGAAPLEMRAILTKAAGEMNATEASEGVSKSEAVESSENAFEYPELAYDA